MSYNNPRIKLGQTLMNAIMVLGEGNPGAITVLLRIMKEGEDIDPDSALGSLGPLLALDNNDIYGSNIWVLYKDVCGEDLIKMLAVLRANQLGLLSASKLRESIQFDQANYCTVGLTDLNEIVEAVQEQLPNFGQL